jgi:hypothetical protein
MRKIAMALFKQDETKRASMKAEKKIAGLDDEYRSTLLESGVKVRYTCLLRGQQPQVLATLF